MNDRISRKHYRPFILVICILCFQVFFSVTRIDEPFLDGELPWYFGNAYFLLRARHCNYDPDLPIGNKYQNALKVFGRGKYNYDEKGEISNLTFYSHHPLLCPTLFRLYTKVFGYGNWVPRSFMLILSLMTSVVLFVFIRRFLKNDWLSAWLTLLYTILPLNFMYMDQWVNENMANLSLLSCFYFLSKASLSQKYRLVFLLNVFFMFQTEWTVYFAAPLILMYLYSKRKEAGYERLVLITGIISILGIAANFAVLYAHGFDLEQIWRVGEIRIGAGIEDMGIGIWITRQFSFLNMNFEHTNLVLFLVGMIYIFLRKNRQTNMLLFASLLFTFTGICWIGIFKNLSFIHHTAQWPFGLAYILMLAAILADAPQDIFGTRQGKAVVIAIAVPIIFLTAWDTYQFREHIRTSTFGSASDIEAIKTFKKRLVIFSDGRSGPKGWWLTPVIELAQDPIFQGSAKKKSSVVKIERISKLNPETDILVILNNKKAMETFGAYCSKRYGIKVFRLIRKSRSFSFFQFR